MLILGIETSTQQVGVALADDADGGDGGNRGGPGPRPVVLASATLAQPSRHAESLAPAVAFLCRTAGVTPAELGALAVGIGPGLFTGLRVGMATAQALALALDVPAVGVPSLEVVAHGVPGAPGPRLVAMDARRGELFWALFQRSAAGELHRCGSDRADAPERVAAAAAELGPGAVVVGDGPERYPAAFVAALAGRPDVVVVTGPAARPSPIALVELGARALAEGRGGPAAALAPRYVREPDAVRWPASTPTNGREATQPAPTPRPEPAVAPAGWLA